MLSSFPSAVVVPFVANRLLNQLLLLLWASAKSSGDKLQTPRFDMNWIALFAAEVCSTAGAGISVCQHKQSCQSSGTNVLYRQAHCVARDGKTHGDMLPQTEHHFRDDRDLAGPTAAVK